MTGNSPHPSTMPAADAALAMPADDVPGSPNTAAHTVSQVSPEGRPASGDAKTGPTRMLSHMALAAGVVLVGSFLIGLWFGLVAGLASLAIGLAAIAFNPVLGAAAMRVQDRSEAIRRTTQHP
jgi:hypothetical protein